MKQTHATPSVRTLNEVIKTTTSIQEIKEVTSSFISNMSDYSSSDQAFLLTMLGLKMMKLSNQDEESIAEVVSEYSDR